MRLIFTAILSLCFTLSFSQTKSKTNVVLIGVYHFNNPGFDQGKINERNILSNENQNGLERITDKLLKTYKPSKVFVEYDYDKRDKLNEMYRLYKFAKPYYKKDTLKEDYYKRFYAENEIFQFGFRLSKKADNDLIYAMDYDKVPIRFDLIKSKISQNSALHFSNYQNEIAALENFMNDCVSKNSLENVLKCLNSDEQYRLNKGLYISFLNKLNKDSDFFGSELVAGWYKRNLIMYANIQNQVSASDKNIVIIVGAGHAAIMEDFIKADPKFNLIRIDKIL
ncbi:hypothetical protein TH53_21105 [Pedobacter lusitanus]|uniref:Contig104, whole genome shotgun sequence n=1 Tax=Pedobacter lusitanus TaxID=1503925 RepID=A0A0D0F164_9SPHI|nr:DUF5694 domain-containing protein [Pedobacter lusitanus]KIO75353.1 hypothetical protein TH53_21105 [Pedobacter lusitanus]